MEPVYRCAWESKSTNSTIEPCMFRQTVKDLEGNFIKINSTDWKTDKNMRNFDSKETQAED